MIDVEKIVEQIDCICYRNFAIARVYSPFYMSIARNSDVYFLRNVVHVDEDCFVLILKRGCDIAKVRAFFDSSKELIDDVQLV